MSSKVYNLWKDIQDIIGPATLWPFKIRKNFWNNKITHFDRIILCDFSYINGLNPLVLLQWFRLISVTSIGDDRERHIIYIFKSLEEGIYKGLYSWNIYNGRYETIDGSIRMYGRKIKQGKCFLLTTISTR